MKGEDWDGIAEELSLIVNSSERFVESYVKVAMVERAAKSCL